MTDFTTHRLGVKKTLRRYEIYEGRGDAAMKGKDKGEKFDWIKWAELLKKGTPEERREYLRRFQRKPTVRYYYWEAEPPSFEPQQFGMCSGYNSIEELKRDHKYSIERVQRGESLGWITRAEIVEEIE